MGQRTISFARNVGHEQRFNFLPCLLFYVFTFSAFLLFGIESGRTEGATERGGGNTRVHAKLEIVHHTANAM